MKFITLFIRAVLDKSNPNSLKFNNVDAAITLEAPKGPNTE
jgi:hypothetical protein